MSAPKPKLRRSPQPKPRKVWWLPDSMKVEDFEWTSSVVPPPKRESHTPASSLLKGVRNSEFDVVFGRHKVVTRLGQLEQAEWRHHEVTKERVV
jgi:hypothetical protein